MLNNCYLLLNSDDSNVLRITARQPDFNKFQQVQPVSLTSQQIDNLFDYKSILERFDYQVPTEKAKLTVQKVLLYAQIVLANAHADNGQWVLISQDNNILATNWYSQVINLVTNLSENKNSIELVSLANRFVKDFNKRNQEQMRSVGVNAKSVVRLDTGIFIDLNKMHTNLINSNHKDFAKNLEQTEFYNLNQPLDLYISDSFTISEANFMVVKLAVLRAYVAKHFDLNKLTDAFNEFVSQVKMGVQLNGKSIYSSLDPQYLAFKFDPSSFVVNKINTTADMWQALVDTSANKLAFANPVLAIESSNLDKSNLEKLAYQLNHQLNTTNKDFLIAQNNGKEVRGLVTNFANEFESYAGKYFQPSTCLGLNNLQQNFVGSAYSNWDIIANDYASKGAFNHINKTLANHLHSNCPLALKAVDSKSSTQNQQTSLQYKTQDALRLGYDYLGNASCYVLLGPNNQQNLIDFYKQEGTSQFIPLNIDLTNPFVRYVERNLNKTNSMDAISEFLNNKREIELSLGVLLLAQAVNQEYLNSPKTFNDQDLVVLTSVDLQFVKDWDLRFNQIMTQISLTNQGQVLIGASHLNSSFNPIELASYEYEYLRADTNRELVYALGYNYNFVEPQQYWDKYIRELKNSTLKETNFIQQLAPLTNLYYGLIPTLIVFRKQFLLDMYQGLNQLLIEQLQLACTNPQLGLNKDNDFASLSKGVTLNKLEQYKYLFKAEKEFVANPKKTPFALDQNLVYLDLIPLADFNNNPIKSGKLTVDLLPKVLNTSQLLDLLDSEQFEVKHQSLDLEDQQVIEQVVQGYFIKQAKQLEEEGLVRYLRFNYANQVLYVQVAHNQTQLEQIIKQISELLNLDSQLEFFFAKAFLLSFILDFDGVDRVSAIAYYSYMLRSDIKGLIYSTQVNFCDWMTFNPCLAINSSASLKKQQEHNSNLYNIGSIQLAKMSRSDNRVTNQQNSNLKSQHYAWDLTFNKYLALEDNSQAPLPSGQERLAKDYLKNVRKYIISLPSNTDRLEQFFSQEHTDDFIVKQAVYGKELSQEQIDKVFDSQRFAKQYNRMPAKGEIGCTLSHWEIYQEVLNNPDIDDEDWVLICEDDTKFFSGWYERTNALLEAINKDPTQNAKFLQCNNNWLLFDRVLSYRELDTSSFWDLRPETNFIVSEKQGYFIPKMLSTFGSSHYLIKKSILKSRTFASIAKPYWVADHFDECFNFSEGDIVYANPMLSYQDLTFESVINDERVSAIRDKRNKAMTEPGYNVQHFISYDSVIVIQQEKTVEEINELWPHACIITRDTYDAMSDEEMHKHYDLDKFQSLYNRMPTRQEMIRALMHREAYKIIKNLFVTTYNYYLIVEDICTPLCANDPSVKLAVVNNMIQWLSSRWTTSTCLIMLSNSFVDDALEQIKDDPTIDNAFIQDAKTLETIKEHAQDPRWPQANIYLMENDFGRLLSDYKLNSEFYDSIYQIYPDEHDKEFKENLIYIKERLEKEPNHPANKWLKINPEIKSFNINPVLDLEVIGRFTRSGLHAYALLSYIPVHEQISEQKIFWLADDIVKFITFATNSFAYTNPPLFTTRPVHKLEPKSR